MTYPDIDRDALDRWIEGDAERDSDWEHIEPPEEDDPDRRRQEAIDEPPDYDDLLATQAAEVAGQEWLHAKRLEHWRDWHARRAPFLLREIRGEG